MSITYQFNFDGSIQDIINLYKISFVEFPRPVDDEIRMKKIFDHSSIIACAYSNNRLIGICRALSDFGYVTYISDLAVDPDYQRQSIGKTLIKMIQDKCGSHCKIVLLSNNNANTFYSHIGFQKHERAWTLD